MAATYVVQDSHVDKAGIQGLILEYFSKELTKQQGNQEAESRGK